MSNPLVLTFALLIAPALAFAQQPVTPLPALQAVQDLRIDAMKESVIKASVLALGPDGRIVSAAGPYTDGASIVPFDSSGKRLGWKVGIGRSDSLEVGGVTAIGWQWPTMFVLDPFFRQFILIDARGKVTKSIEYPSLIKPGWADRRKFPVFSRAEALALYPDGSMLVLPSPRSDASPLDTPEYDSKSLHLLRVSAAGAIQRVIAKLPLNPSTDNVRSARGVEPARLWSASPNGARVAVASLPMTGKDSGMIRVTALSDRGDTVYSRAYSYKAVMTQRGIDSAAARAKAAGGTASQVAALIDRLGKVGPLVTGVRVGRDQTVWLALRESALGRPYLGLDLRGDPIGIVTVDRAVSLIDFTHDRALGLERDKLNVNTVAVVRYRLTARKP